jgi:hypothetical protein
VIGKDVPYALLAAIAELPEAALQQGLARVQTSEFLYETHLFPELEYTFKHALTHEVAYGSLLQERRRALHARLVTAIELLYAERLVEQSERLARHAVRGEVWDKAVVYSRQAGQKAASRSVYAEAVAYFEQALDALALFYFPFGADQDRAAHDAQVGFPQKTLHPAGLIGFDRHEFRVAEQRKIRLLLGLEFGLRFDGIRAAAEHNGVEPVEFTFQFAKFDGFRCAAGGAGLGIKVKRDVLAAQILERNSTPVIGG